MSDPTKDGFHRRVIENKAGLLAVLSTVAISVGGIAEIAPMYAVPQDADAPVLAPYTPLELAGRDIYVREGCYNCHSQWVRPLRAEVTRYGEWTRSWEYQWDRPFQLGSRRIGPDVQRVGGKYPDAWHYEHMRDPRATSPGSIMPAYTWLYDDDVDAADVAASMSALATLGHPYSDTSAAYAAQAMHEQASALTGRLAQQNIQVDEHREIVALIAYLQRLGVDGKREIARQGGN